MSTDEVGIPLQAFSALLYSNNVATVCRALNMYQVAASYTRLSGGNPLEPLGDEVRVVALDILSRPPVEGDEDIQPGFDHLSALNVLSSLAQPEDAGVIATVLENTEGQLWATALLAAAAVPVPDERLVGVLETMAADESRDEVERTRAGAVRNKLLGPER